MTGKLKVKVKVKRTSTPKATGKSVSFHISSFRQMLEQHLDKIERGYYVPNQKYDSIRGRDEGSAFTATANLVRSIHNTITAERPTEDGAAARLATRIRGKEAKVLTEHFQKQGMIIDEEEFRSLWEASHMLGGAEHHVALIGNDQVLKRRMLAPHETMFTTLNKVAEHNIIFPETEYTLRGVMNDRGTSIMYSQPMFKKLSVDSAMHSLGFTPEEITELNNMSGKGQTDLIKQKIDDKAKLQKASVSKERLKEVQVAHEYLTTPAYGEIKYDEIKAYMAAKGFHPDMESVKDLAGYSFDESIDISIDMSLLESRSKPIIKKSTVAESKPAIVDNENTELLDFLVFRNEQTGMQVRDLGPRNFIRTVEGKIVAVDPMILANVKTQKERIEEELRSLS